MPSFSILTVSKRTGWEADQAKTIQNQTVQPEKWVIVTEDEYTHPALQSWPGTEVVHLKAPPKTRASNMIASENHGLKQITSDYVIMHQDFIDLEPDCYEKLLDLADEQTWVTTCTPNYDGSDDDRYTGIDGPRGCLPQEWEQNVALAPMQMIRELGGFWDELDNGWAWDNVDLAQRAAMLGARFILDESNRPKLYPHEMSSHKTIPLNGERVAQHIEAIRNGTMPINVNCL